MGYIFFGLDRMYGLLNSENIFNLRWALKFKGQGQTPQKIEEYFYSSLQ